MKQVIKQIKNNSKETSQGGLRIHTCCKDINDLSEGIYLKTSTTTETRTLGSGFCHSGKPRKGGGGDGREGSKGGNSSNKDHKQSIPLRLRAITMANTVLISSSFFNP